MKVITPAGEAFDLGATEEAPTVGIIDYSRRETDDYGVTTVVERGFSRRMSVRLSVPFDAVDTLQQRLASLRATAASWVADERFACLSFDGFYKEFDIDLNVPPVSWCTMTVEGLAASDPFTDPGDDPAPDGRSSTLQVLKPTLVTDGMLTSNVPETDYPQWSAGTTYPLGARVLRGEAHRIFESVLPGNLGHDPAADAPEWIDIGPTNRWAMFDRALGSVTSAAGEIVVTLAAGAVDSVALLDVKAATVRVQAGAFDRAESAAAGAVTIADIPAAGGPVTVTIAGPGQVEVGTLLTGRMLGLGITEANAGAGITDYSRKEVDEFGEVTIVERAWAKRMTAKGLLATEAVDLAFDRIASVRALPCLWVGQDGLQSLSVYGFFKEFSIELGENVSKLSLSIEGLSTAGKVEPLAASVNWPDVGDPAGTKPEDNATVGAPAGTDVAGKPAEEIVGQLEEQEQALAQLNTDIAQANIKIAAAQATIARMQIDAAEIQAELVQQQEDLAAAQADILANGENIESIEVTLGQHGASITEIQATADNQAGQLAELTTTVSTQGSTIGQHGIAITTLQGSYASLSSTVSAQDASITQLQTASSTQGGQIAQLTTQVSAGRQSLLPNGDFSNGLTDWTASVGGGWSVSSEWTGRRCTTSITGAPTLLSPRFPVQPNSTITAGVVAQDNRATNPMYMQFRYEDGAGGSLQYKEQVFLTGGLSRKSVTSVVPSGAVYGRLWFASTGSASGYVELNNVTVVVGAVDVPNAQPTATITQAITALNTATTQLAGLTTTVSTQGSSITQAQTAITALQNNTATLTTQVTAGRQNLLPNADFSNGLVGWTSGGAGGWMIADAWTGRRCTTTANGIPTLLSPGFAVTVGGNFTVGLVSQDARPTSSMYLQCRFENSSGAIIWGDSMALSKNVLARTSKTFTVPAGAVLCRLWFAAPASDTGYVELNNITVVIGNVDVPNATPTASVAQAFSALSTLNTQYASLSSTVSTQGVTVSQNSTAITTLNTNVTSLMGRWGIEIDVNGYVSGVTTNNNGTRADFTIRADRFAIVSPGGGARTEYSNGNWRVYNAAGVLKVQLGVNI